MHHLFRLSLCVVSIAWICSAHAASKDAILDALQNKQWEKAHRLSQQGGDSFVRSLAEWYYLTRSDTIASHTQYQRFMKAHPDWPGQERLKTRMEIAFLNTSPEPQTLIRWFSNYPPTSSRAILLLLSAKGKVQETDLRTHWVDGDFSRQEEERLRRAYRNKLTPDIHAARLDRLLFDGQYVAAERLLPLVDTSTAKLAKARIAVARNRNGVDGLIAALPAASRLHPGLIYERIRYRAKRGNYRGVEELLLQTRAPLPHASQWWKYQHRVIRDAIEDRRYDTARLLLNKHSQIKALPRVEAEWLRGWLHYAFLKQPKTAVTAFKNIYETAKMPISRSRGAYWTARAYEAAGDKSNAGRWYHRAALFPTTFYGQLAHQHVKPGATLAMPATTTLSKQDAKRWMTSHPLANQIGRLALSGHTDLLWPHIKHELSRRNDPKAFAGFAATARISGALPLAINIAKEALNKGIYLPELYPIPSLPSDLAVEPALALAITRQESRFDHKAVSSANARGLMQLLPTTARRVASSHDLSYSLSKLFQPRYSLMVGSHYLHGLLERFNGAHILAIAGYNAGPGRSDQWQDRFGTLSSRDWRRNILWMELIPFSETRNYVQRVLENYHVYRHLLSRGKAPLKAKDMLTETQL